MNQEDAAVDSLLARVYQCAPELKCLHTAMRIYLNHHWAPYPVSCQTGLLTPERGHKGEGP